MGAQNQHTIIVAFGSLAAGLLIRYVIGRRRFNRRGMAGLQQYRSYRGAVIISTLEAIVIRLATIAILIGLVLLANAYFFHPKIQKA